MTTKFYVEIKIQDNTLRPELEQWVADCTDLEISSSEGYCELHLWDMAAFAYALQLDEALPSNIVVIAPGDNETEKQVLLTGVLDFISDRSSFSVIALRLSLHIQRLQYVRQLESLSVTDPLTGLYNRRKFNEAMDTCWRQSIRMQLPCSLLMLDVDHFKIFNDTYGHLVGDECLKSLSDVFCLEAVRPHDTVARIGGEEFAIILPETSIQGAEHVASRIIQRVKELSILNEHTQLGVVSVSVGIACAYPKMGDNLSHWQQEADDALYFAKDSGRNQVKTEVERNYVQETLLF